MIYALFILPSILIYLIPLNTLFKKTLIINISLLLAIIAFSRGEIGTDTLAYESIIRSIQENISINLEPLFVIYAGITKLLGADEKIATRGLSLILFAQIIIYAKNSTKDQLFLLSFLIIPVFSLSFSTNILRAGIACMFFALYLQKENKKLIIFSVLSQYSSILIYALNQILNKRINIKYALLASFFSIIFIQLNQDYINEKINIYSDTIVQSKFSGLGILIPILLILASILFNKKTDKIIKITFIYLIASLLCFFLSQFSYAFLRILSLLHFSLPLIYLKTLEHENIRLNKHQKIIISISCFIACAFLIKNINESNYFPYHTFY